MVSITVLSAICIITSIYFILVFLEIEPKAGILLLIFIGVSRVQTSVRKVRHLQCKILGGTHSQGRAISLTLRMGAYLNFVP